MTVRIALSGVASLVQLDAVLETNPVVLSALIGIVLAVVSLGVRYRYSTGHALFYIVSTIILAVSPLATRLGGIDVWFFAGGFALGQTIAIGLDYSYRVVVGDPTGAAAFRTVTAQWLDRLRDRRRTIRRRIEAILDRKTIIAVLVGMPLSELMKATGVRFLAAEPIQWHLAWAHVVLVLVGLTIGIHWQHVKDAAESAGDTAEDIVNGDDDSN